MLAPYPPETVMSARRCSSCGVDWPDSWPLYGKCPDCLGNTDRMSNVTPLDVDVAQSRKNHADFGRYCEDRDAKQLAALDKTWAAT